MKKYKVEIREVVFIDLEVEARNLDEAISLVKDGREHAGKIVKEETDEMTAKVYHSEGSEDLKLI